VLSLGLGALEAEVSRIPVSCPELYTPVFAEPALSEEQVYQL
jgi:hypothetical protein